VDCHDASLSLRTRTSLGNAGRPNRCRLLPLERDPFSSPVGREPPTSPVRSSERRLKSIRSVRMTMQVPQFGEARLAGAAPCEGCGRQIPAETPLIIVSAIPPAVRNLGWFRWRFCSYEHLAQRAEAERLMWESLRATKNVAFTQNPDGANREIEGLEIIEAAAQNASTG
jgi:hypothetical protein